MAWLWFWPRSQCHQHYNYYTCNNYYFYNYNYNYNYNYTYYYYYKYYYSCSFGFGRRFSLLSFSSSFSWCGVACERMRELWQSVRARIEESYQSLGTGLRRRRGTHDDHDDEEDAFVPPSVAVIPRHNDEDDEDDDDEELHHPAADAIEPNTSFLYALTKRWAWEAVVVRCQTHPGEAQCAEQDSNGDTMLHWACSGNPPVVVVEAILEAAKGLARIRNDRGLLPLHTACLYRASPAVVTALLGAFPESAGATIGGDTEQRDSTPLHLLCDYGCAAGAIEAVAATPGGAASCAQTDALYRRTPLELLNERKNLAGFHECLSDLRRLRQRQRDRKEGGEEDDEQDEQDDEDTTDTVYLMERIRSLGFWDKARCLVLAEVLGAPAAASDEEADTADTTILHALVLLSDRCSPSILEFGILLRPGDLRTPDAANGELPLHCAARIATDAVVLDVLAADPGAAAITDGHGTLALGVYLGRRHRRSGWNRALEELVLANPLALESLGVDPRLYPRVWSRLTAGAKTPRDRSRRDRVLDALYRSVRGHPDLFR